MWHHVQVVLTDVSEERITSVFRVEGKIRKSAREASVRDVKSRLVLEINTASASREAMVGGQAYMGNQSSGGERPDRNRFLYMILCRGVGVEEIEVEEGPHRYHRAQDCSSLEKVPDC
jgi:hypothetical protein